MCLSLEERQLVRDVVAWLEGYERFREYARIRSRLLRLNPEYRAVDNAKQAVLGREKYHANLEELNRGAKSPRWTSFQPAFARHTLAGHQAPPRDRSI